MFHLPVAKLHTNKQVVQICRGAVSSSRCRLSRKFSLEPASEEDHRETTLYRSYQAYINNQSTMLT